MRIGVGLPSTIPGAPASLSLDWARRADAGPFSTLATLDRLAYDSLDSLTALAAVAAITTRVRIATNILVSPLYTPATLAKAAASLDALSGGRLVLGVAVGGREDDFEVTGAAFGERGKAFDRMLAEWQEIWDDEAIGPAAHPTVIIGGSSPAAFRRAAAHDIKGARFRCTDRGRRW